MDFISIVTVLWFTIKPFLLLISFLLVSLLLSQIIGRDGWKQSTSSTLWVLSIVIAIVAMLIAPTFTDSELRYVLTFVDKFSLLAVGIGAFVYSWLMLRPWLINRK